MEALFFVCFFDFHLGVLSKGKQIVPARLHLSGDSCSWKMDVTLVLDAPLRSKG